MSCVVKLKPFDPRRFFYIPNYASKYSAGKDIKASISEPIEIKSQQSVLIPTNLKVEIPPYFIRKIPKILGVFGERTIYENANTGFELELQIRPKSGYSTKKQLIITNSPGTIDSDYRGEIKVSFTNVGPNTQWVYPEESIAQIVLAPIVRFDWDFTTEFTETERNEKGFGEMTAQNEDEDKSFHEVDMTVYYICTRYSYCLKCGKHELKLKESSNESNPNVIHKQCDFCGQTFQWMITSYPEYVSARNKKSIGMMPFSPIYPTEEDIIKIINEDERFKPTENEIFFLRNPNIIT